MTTVIKDVKKVDIFQITNGTGYQKDGNTTHQLEVKTDKPLNGTYLLQCLVKGRPNDEYYSTNDALITSKQSIDISVWPNCADPGIYQRSEKYSLPHNKYWQFNN